jgi:hypothetical protein
MGGRVPFSASPAEGSIGRGARLVLFDADGGSVAVRRRAQRERLLRMRPADPTVRARAARASAFPETGLHWEYVTGRESALLVRARDASDRHGARVDAGQLFARADRLRVVLVRDDDVDEIGWWLVGERSVVAVSPRVWGTDRLAGVTAARKHSQRALEALAGPVPPWGALAR